MADVIPTHFLSLLLSQLPHFSLAVFAFQLKGQAYSYLEAFASDILSVSNVLFPEISG